MAGIELPSKQRIRMNEIFKIRFLPVIQFVIFPTNRTQATMSLILRIIKAVTKR